MYARLPAFADSLVNDTIVRVKPRPTQEQQVIGTAPNRGLEVRCVEYDWSRSDCTQMQRLSDHRNAEGESMQERGPRPREHHGNW
jgi:hypothetical protein